AIGLAGAALSRRVDGWRERLLVLSAQLEATLDFADENDAETLPSSFGRELTALAWELAQALAAPAAARLREGLRVALAGPPNAGKSPLFNARVESDADITAPPAGTPRDGRERPGALGGMAFTFVDLAGLRIRRDDRIGA